MLLLLLPPVYSFFKKICIAHIYLELQLVKNQPAIQEILVQFLGPEDPLEEGMATHSSVAWRIPGTEEPGGLQSTGLQRVGHTDIDLLIKGGWYYAC